MRAVAAIACAVVAAAYLVPALVQIHPVGAYAGPYGDAVEAVSVAERHTTNVTATVAYDVRGLDTLGEELLLFATVIGVALLMRMR